MPDSSPRWKTCFAVYRRPYDPDRPVVCMDEMSSRQLLRQVRDPIESEARRARTATTTTTSEMEP